MRPRSPTRRPARRRTVAVLATLLALTAACSDASDDPAADEGNEDVAADARADIDALAAEVGTDPEVVQDVITDCVPGQKDSGQDLIYKIHVSIEPGTLDRLATEVADRYEADGWDVRRRGDDDIVFRKDGVTMGARVSQDSDRATVSGTGGCVT